MPMNDTDNVFVAAMVFCTGLHPNIGSTHDLGKSSVFLSCLKKLDVDFCFCTIKPYPGYGESIQSKLSKMDTMARTTRLLTGRNTDFLPPDNGLPFGNMVWIYAMQSALQTSLVETILEGPVTSVELYLDRKTMAKATRDLFITHIQGLRKNLFEVLLKLDDIAPPERKGIYRNCRFERILVKWSDDPGTEDAADGLRLAHYVASLSRSDLISRKQKFLQPDIAAREHNITGYWATPISPEAVKSWERLTGLTEPKI